MKVKCDNCGFEFIIDEDNPEEELDTRCPQCGNICINEELE